MAIHTIAYNVAVPKGRTYIVRDFRFHPSKAVYDNFNNPYPDFYQWYWQVNSILKGETVAPQQFATSPINTFSGAGSLTWMPCFFVVEQFQVLTLNVQTIDLSNADELGETINYIVDVRFNSLLNDSRPGPFQVGNPVTEADLTTERLKRAMP